MKLKDLIIRYRAPLLSLIILSIFMIIMPEHAPRAKSSVVDQIKTLALIVPPIFLLLGLLDVWVPREIMMRFMGPDAGLRGPILAFALGSAAAGPLYGAFPVAGVLMKKGATFHNILIFIGAWSTTKIPMILFEMKALGTRFALARLAIDIIGIALIAFALKKAIPAKEVEKLYEKARGNNRDLY